MILKHDAAFERRIAHPFSGDDDLAVVIAIESGDQAQQRGLAATARTDHADEFAGAHMQRDVIEHSERGAALRVALADVANVESIGGQNGAHREVLYVAKQVDEVMPKRACAARTPRARWHVRAH